MYGEPITRRAFLKTAASAVALPGVITSSALGANGRASAGERLVMAAVGLGGQGTRHIGGGIWVQGGGFLSMPDVQLVAVCDVNSNNLNRARDIVNKYYGNNDCATYGDYRELFARDDIDIILCATGDRWHSPVSIAAARAGKDIYCEKPISLTVYEAGELARTVRRYNRIFQTGTQQRSWHEFRFACELVLNGYIGRLKHVTVNVGGPPQECDLPAGGTVPDWLDYDMWLGQAPWRPFHPGILGWMAWSDYSGGEMTNWGAHMFDIAQWAMGMDESGPVEIIPPDGGQYRVLTYRYANGVTMIRDKINRSEPGVLFEGTEGKIEVTRQYLATEPEHLIRQKIGPDEIHLYESKNHPENFVKCAKSRQRPASDADVGYRSITVCHLGNIAYRLNRPLKWDPEKEQFVNDPQADRMLKRPMRSPWRI